ncbi:MAG: hypothetical protein CSB55_08505 [Candidatus Cloacimonadota bacterium]|nr:MAG: hypothetical protein CSB55_08505 [Candidatus Cloacimonadota bacterium]
MDGHLKKIFTTLIFIAFSVIHSVIVNEISIDSEFTEENITREYLLFESGRNYKEKELEHLITQTKQNLLDTKYYDYVVIKQEKISDKALRIKIKTTKRFQIQPGGGWLYLSAKYQNFAGKGIDIYLRAGTEQQFKISVPKIPESIFKLKFCVSHRFRSDKPEMITDKKINYRDLRVSFEPGININHHLSWSLGPVYYKYFTENKYLIFLPDCEYWFDEKISLRSTWKFSNRNMKETPSSGLYVFLDNEYFPSEKILSDKLDIRFYKPIYGKTYLLIRGFYYGVNSEAPYPVWQKTRSNNYARVNDTPDKVTDFKLLTIEFRYRFSEIYNAVYFEPHIFTDFAAMYLNPPNIKTENRKTERYGMGGGIKIHNSKLTSVDFNADVFYSCGKTGFLFRIGKNF